MPDYTPSYYSQTLSERFQSDPLETAQNVDVCIVGGGIAALSCAQSLIEAGRSVAVIDAGKVFSGASGLNGGFVSPGYALAGGAIEARVGLEKAKRLFALTVAGTERIRSNIRQYDINSASKVDGKIRLLRYAPSQKDEHHVAEMHDKYGYDIEAVDKVWLRQHLSSEAYQYGFLFRDAFHMHPLNYGVAMYDQLHERGLKIVENVQVLSIKASHDTCKVHTTAGKITARQVAICTGGYTSTENSTIHRSIFPITTYAAVTEPDDSIPGEHIKTPYALGDTRRASDYYRIVSGNQLLWGGRITAFPKKVADTIAALVKHDIQRSYPRMQSIRIRVAWSGVMGYAMHKMPYVGQLPSGLWYCTAFGGHGLGPGTGCGDALARAILGDRSDVDLFRSFPLQRTFGFLGKIGVEATYKKYILMDHVHESTRYA